MCDIAVQLRDGCKILLQSSSNISVDKKNVVNEKQFRITVMTKLHNITSSI